MKIMLYMKLVLEKIRITCMSGGGYIEYLRKQGVKIGTGCSIDKSAYFGGEPFLISVGNNVRIPRGVEFITHDGGLWTLRKMGLIDKEAVKYGKIQIGDNCNFGWDVIVMPNVKIGNNCVIAAGAVVTKDVPEGMVYGGIPAKKIETIEEYFNKVKDKTVPTYSMTKEQKIEYLSNHTDLMS